MGEETEPASTTTVSSDYDRFSIGGNAQWYGVPCTLYAKLYDTPRTCSLELYREIATGEGKRIVEVEHPGGGNGYSAQYQNNNQYGYATMSHFWRDYVRPAFADADPAVDYKDVLVVHGNKPDGFCFDAERGAMHAFGERTPGSDNGYGYCRGGANAAKRVHIYVLIQ